jgi:RimJ/RimL family protein N-acetyltransferase
MELLTPRLRLRPLAEEDAEAMARLDSDPEVRRYLGPGSAADPATYARQLREWTQLGDGRDHLRLFLAAETLDGADWIGWLHLRPAREFRYAREAGYQSDELDLGYRLARRVWGRGYATEAAAALVRRGAATPGFRRVVASALAGNAASLRVMEKAGLVREAYFQLPGFDQASIRYGTPR